MSAPTLPLDSAPLTTNQDSSPAIVFENVKLAFPGNDVLRGISFRLARGETKALFGVSRSHRPCNGPDRRSCGGSACCCANAGSDGMSPEGACNWIAVCVKDFCRFFFHVVPFSVVFVSVVFASEKSPLQIVPPPWLCDHRNGRRVFH